MTLKPRLMTSLLAGFTSLAAGLALAQTAPDHPTGGTVIVSVAQEPNSLNASLSSSISDVIAGCIVSEALIIENEDGTFEPMLAESWTISDDGKTYSFKLREANWHDGTPFTAEDVRFTIADVYSKFSPRFANQAASMIDSVTAPDDRTVVIQLNSEYGPMLQLLTCVSGGQILPKHVYAGSDPLANGDLQAPIGTGPFKFGEWVRGDHVTFVRNDDYWDAGRPYLDAVILRPMPNGTSRVQALMTGEIDVIPFTALPPKDAKIFAQNPATKLELSGIPPTTLLAFLNTTRPPLDDVRVRQALVRATDREFILNTAYPGLGRKANNTWTTQIEWAHDPNVSYDKSYPFDAAAAAAVLDEAGLAPDASGTRFELDLIYDPAFPERETAVMGLQAMWRSIGVKVNLQPFESSVLLPKAHIDGEFDVYVQGYASFGDPAISVARTYNSATIGQIYGNASRYSNPEVEALFDQAGRLTTKEDRGAVYKQIEPILMQDVPVIMLHDMKGYDAANAKLQGAWGWAGHPRYGIAWLEP